MSDGTVRLTPRQLEVLELMAKGLTNREIADVLGIATGTAKLHVSAVIDALDVTNRTEAAVALQELSTTSRQERAARPVPGFGGRPAIAVLPFDNLSPDPQQDFFADALVEDLTTQLAAWRWFPVIARNSTFAMRGRTVTEVGRELGARYVVEGSTRAQAEHVRIQVQVVDAENGEHVYAQRYDRELTDVFAVQDEIVEAIVGVLEPLLLRLEGLKALRKPPGSLGVWEQVQRGVSLLHTQAMADARVALEHFDRAIELDSTYAPAHAGRAAARLLVGLGRLGASHAVGGTADELRAALAEAVAGFVDAMTTGRRATELDPLDPNGFLALGGGLSLTGQNESALVAFERALALNPSSALVCFMTGNALAWGPRWQEAGELFERALRLSPHDPALHHVEGALAGFRFRQGCYEEALDLARRSREHEPQGAMSYRPFITASLAFLGRLDEARAECEAMRAYRPGWNGQLARFLGPAAAVDRLFEGIRLAGWEVPDPTGPTAGTSR